MVLKVTDEEFEKAKAFVLCFPEYYCEEYEILKMNIVNVKLS